MKLIVGLGNPGKEYENTRHNVGFMFIDRYLKNVNFENKFNGLFYSAQINGEKVIFLKPLSYMNQSGTVVKKYVDYYKIDISDVLIVRDDLDMLVGKAKIKQNSSSGGDNGIKSIISELGSQAFTQLKIGILNNKLFDKKDFVLSKFSGDEIKSILDVIDKALPIIDDFVNLDAEELMNKYNGILK